MAQTLILLALGLGFATSLHCVGMCGPIALSIGLSAKNKLKFTLKNLTYQFGRVTTYTILGLILGLIGEGFSFVGFQNYLSIAIGVLMIIMVLIPKFFDNQSINTKPLQAILLKVKVGLGRYLRRQDFSSLYTTGLLNGLLPCGAVYAALTAAIGVGSFEQSTLFMFFFGLGTIPLMFLTVMFGNFISLEWRQKILKILPIIILVLGILFILRGLELNIPYISPSKEVLQIDAAEYCQ
ncbi:sulfite exporter TauE/SafE family protein [Weeksella sp. HMSC059D05]|uniref:sulfite exporter TauE/SafE family protein n=1 Tax=Weeksella sp. HMSC059D05 TaxID=1715139 RepID=UPI0008A277EC|nr:sulfite exporter TauE/SafE family protein [Weeksella sp. HMSC059D05]OFM84749.1 cytochrome C biogenesis protein [Weeksella sp. HMSC059D05]